MWVRWRSVSETRSMVATASPSASATWRDRPSAPSAMPRGPGSPARTLTVVPARSVTISELDGIHVEMNTWPWTGSTTVSTLGPVGSGRSPSGGSTSNGNGDDITARGGAGRSNRDHDEQRGTDEHGDDRQDGGPAKPVRHHVDLSGSHNSPSPRPNGAGLPPLSSPTGLDLRAACRPVPVRSTEQ